MASVERRFLDQELKHLHLVSRKRLEGPYRRRVFFAQKHEVIRNNTYAVEITSKNSVVWFSQRDDDIYVSDLDDVLNGVVKIGDVLMSINDRPITNDFDLGRVGLPFVMQLHPIDDQCSSYIKRTRLNDLEAYSIVNQRLVQVNERLRQQRIDEELVCQQQQPIDREIEAQNGKRKRKAAIYS